MANSKVEKQLERLKKKGQKEIYNPSKGLMDILRDSLDKEEEGNKYLGDILSEIVEIHKDGSMTVQKADFGVGKMNKIISDAIASVQMPALPSESDGNQLKFYQATLEWFSLLDLKIDDGLNLQRGLLSNVTQIHMILKRAEKERELLKDKRQYQFKTPKKKKEEIKPMGPSLGGLLGSILGGMGKVLKWLAAPFIWIGKKIWDIMKGAAKKVGAMFKNFWKGFKKAFPRTANFLSKIGRTLTNFADDILKKMPTIVQKVVPKLTKFLGRIFSTALKFLTKLAPWTMIATLVYDFFQGWFNAAEITGKDKADFKDKIIAGVMSILSGLTLGFVDAKDFHEVIFGDHGIIDIVKGWMKDIFNSLPDAVKGPLEQAGGIFSVVKDEWDKVWDNFTGGWSITNALEKLLDDIAKWVDGKITFKNLMPSWLGGEKAKEGEEEELPVDPKMLKKIEEARQKRKADAVARNLDTRSRHLSDKKAVLARQSADKSTTVNVPPPTVIQKGEAQQVNVFEKDLMLMQTR